MAAQGTPFNKEKIQRIIWLLSQTDLAIAEIASRMLCSRSAVVGINKRYKVRHYNGLRTSWKHSKSGEVASQAVEPESNPAA